jgi:RNA polymerase sigma-70 factor, ECF subfamily
MFDEHAQRVFAYAARRSTTDVANEVVAETFLIAWRKLESVPAEPLPWLLNVAGKVLANRRRADQRREVFVRTIPRASSIDPTEVVSTRLAIEKAIERLPPAEREALTLTVWDGLNVREGAAVAGCLRATFSVRLHRARRRVMKELGLERHSRGKVAERPALPAEEAK